MSDFVEQEFWLLGVLNYVLEGDGFYISYNPAPWGAESNQGETALCHKGKYYILIGDYRESYKNLGPLGYAACKAFYDQQSAHSGSSWSSST